MSEAVWTVVTCGECKHHSKDSFTCTRDKVPRLRYEWCGTGEKK